MSTSDPESDPEPPEPSPSAGSSAGSSAGAGAYLPGAAVWDDCPGGGGNIGGSADCGATGGDAVVCCDGADAIPDAIPPQRPNDGRASPLEGIAVVIVRLTAVDGGGREALAGTSIDSL